MKKTVWAAAVIMLIIPFIFLGLKDKQEKIVPAKQEGITLPSVMEGNELYIEAKVLANHLNGNYSFNEIDRALTLTLNHQRFLFIEGVPVVEVNGQYKPIKQNDFFIKGNQVYLSALWLRRFFPTDILIHHEKVRLLNEVKREENVEPVQAPPQNIEHMIGQLQILSSPLKRVKPDLYPSHVPGAKRNYRGGRHEGLDWYSYSTGAVINEQTPVYAMGKGTIVRVDHVYNGYQSEKEREQDLQVCRLHGKTPLYILDRLRGRQVWVQYENGVQARFAHLSKTAKELQVGGKVDEHTLIGFVGNSGTSGEVKKDGTELHLHVDLLLNGRLFWEGFTKEEVVSIIQAIF
ncbi:M23 family metallopeptidase [Bacillus songklensis]|uniref:M23 family metallopeptidase n=1 Tax=Bacillus songklensis TaxID=1069116 RepID=A0ABV8B1X3_9BACI